MLNQILKKELDKYEVKDVITLSFAMREIAQKITLQGLNHSRAFDHIAFYGGTCLRLFFGLDRFSEDLDFALLDNDEFSLDFAEHDIKHCFETYGISAIVDKKPNHDSDSISRRYVKFLLADIAKDYFPQLSLKINPDMNISIKIEVDKGIYGNFKTINVIMDLPFDANIKIFDISTLFSSKIVAILYRKWKDRVKGRDYFDYLFYSSKKTPINIDYLRFKLGDNNLTEQNIKDMLIGRFGSVNFKKVVEDVLPFVKDISVLKELNRDFFVSTVKDLTFCELNPNNETVEAIKEINEISDNTKSCDDVDEMFDDILK